MSCFPESEKKKCFIRSFKRRNFRRAKNKKLTVSFSFSGMLSNDSRDDNPLAWRGLTGEAETMLPLLDPGYAALIRARVVLRRRL